MRILNTLNFKAQRLFWRVICNFIPFKETRIRTRRAKFAKIDKNFFKEKHWMDDTKIISIKEHDKFIPSKILTLINSHSNAQFLAFNRNLTFANSDKQTRERERERDAA